MCDEWEDQDIEAETYKYGTDMDDKDFHRMMNSYDKHYGNHDDEDDDRKRR